MNQLNVGISEFRRNLSGFLKLVNSGTVIHLLYRGKEIAILVPPDFTQRVARQELEALRETAVVGDVLSPLW